MLQDTTLWYTRFFTLSITKVIFLWKFTIYIIWAPFTAHAIGRSHLFEDDSFVPADEIKNRLKDPSFIHPIDEFRETSESPEIEENDDFSISKIDIVEE